MRRPKQCRTFYPRKTYLHPFILVYVPFSFLFCLRSISAEGVASLSIKLDYICTQKIDRQTRTNCKDSASFSSLPHSSLARFVVFHFAMEKYPISRAAGIEQGQNHFLAPNNFKRHFTSVGKTRSKRMAKPVVIVLSLAATFI